MAALAMVLALASPAGAQQRDAEARAVFDRGTERMNEGHYLEAAHLYERAYELSPRALILLNVSTAYERALELSAAADALEQYLDSSDAPEDEAVLRRRLARLRRLALLEQNAQPSEPAPASATPDASPPGTAPPADAGAAVSEGSGAESASPAVGPATPAQPSPGTPVEPAAPPQAGAVPGRPSVGPGRAVGVRHGVGAGVEGGVQAAVGVGQPVAAPPRAPAIEPRPLVTWTSMPNAAPPAAVAAEPATPTAPEPRGPANGWGVFGAVTGGLGLVSTAIGGIIGGLAIGDVQSACGDHVCPSSASDTIDQARALTDVADVFGGVGVSLGAIAIGSMIIAIAQVSGGPSEDTDDEDEGDGGSEVRLRVAPCLIEGSF